MKLNGGNKNICHISGTPENKHHNSYKSIYSVTILDGGELLVFFTELYKGHKGIN